MFFHDSIDLYDYPKDTMLDLAQNKVRQAIKHLHQLVLENKIDEIIDPYLVSIIVLEEVLEKRSISIKSLRDNALLFGYIDSFIKYLWNRQTLEEMYPKLSDKEIDKLMFEIPELINSVDPIEIGYTPSSKSYVVFLPSLSTSGQVDMEYKLIMDCF